MTYPVNHLGAQFSPYIGYLRTGNDGSVIDAEDVYLSAEGPTLRHFKNAARTEFWDEVLVATRNPNLIDPARPVGGTGPQGYPV